MKILVLSLLFLLLSCGKEDTDQSQSSNELAIISASRNLSLEGVLSLHDISVGDELIFELSGRETYPTFELMSVFTYPDERTSCGCYIFRRVYTGEQYRPLSELEVMKSMYVIIDNKVQYISKYIKATAKENAKDEKVPKYTFSLKIVPELLNGENFLDLSYDERSQGLIKDIGFIGWDGDCKWRRYITNRDQGDLVKITQEFFISTFVDINYELRRAVN